MPKSEAASRITCDRCSKSLKSVTTLRRHAEVCSNRNSEPRFNCEICGKCFRTNLQCSRHIQYTHCKRPYVCEKSACGRAFSSKSHLLDHMGTHTSDRPFPCSVKGCNYRARTRRRLVQHKVIHGEGRRFSCDYCDYSATTSSNLRRHARIHAGSRPYLCPHCDHRTSELDALKKHVLDSGRHPGLPLYVCRWCSPTTSAADALAPEVEAHAVKDKVTSDLVGVDHEDIGQQKRPATVGFNSSVLAWRHLVTEHASIPVIESCTSRSGGTLKERDVTRLMGIYCPTVDHTKPPEGVAVRQPAIVSRHRCQSRYISLVTAKYGRPRCRQTIKRYRCVTKTNIVDSLLSESCHSPSQPESRTSPAPMSDDSAATDVAVTPPIAMSVPLELHTGEHSPKDLNNYSLNTSTDTFSSKVDSSHQRTFTTGDLIQISSGALWSRIPLLLYNDRIKQFTGFCTSTE